MPESLKTILVAIALFFDAAHVLANNPEEGDGHEAAPQPAQRKPLTYDQAMELTRGALNRLDVVRKTEDAHNIKEQQ